MDKTKELTRILCKWNRRELDARDAMNQIWEVYWEEVLEIWNDPLERLFVSDKEAIQAKGQLYRVKDEKE